VFLSMVMYRARSDGVALALAMADTVATDIQTATGTEIATHKPQ